MAPPTMEKQRSNSQVAESDNEDTASTSPSAEEVTPLRREKKTRKKSKKSKGGNMALDQLPVGGIEETANNTLGNVTNTLGSVGNKALDKQDEKSGGGGKSDTLRLRLDLNLDVEIQLKARIHGDLELALL